MRREAALSLDAYRTLVENLLATGYEPRGFDRVEPDRRHVILRHDVDMSPATAAALAELESELGVRAIYFVLLRSDLYNALSAANLAHLQRIAALGHELGLHFDASLYSDDPDALDVAAGRECGILESALDLRVGTISFHRPARSMLDGERPLAGRLHAYQRRFFSEMGYCSDSRGGWHHGHPLDHEAVRSGRALQLLTHPIWWVAPASEAPAAKLGRFVDAHTEHFERELADHCEPYRAVLAERLARAGRED